MTVAQTTLQRIQAMPGGAFSRVNPESIKLMMDDAWMKMSSMIYKPEKEEYVHRYLTCHLLVLPESNISSKRLDGYGSTVYQYQGKVEDSLTLTPYGKEVKQNLIPRNIGPIVI